MHESRLGEDGRYKAEVPNFVSFYERTPPRTPSHRKRESEPTEVNSPSIRQESRSEEKRFGKEKKEGEAKIAKQYKKWSNVTKGQQALYWCPQQSRTAVFI